VRVSSASCRTSTPATRGNMPRATRRHTQRQDDCSETVAADQQPIACTLTAGDLRDRLTWIGALNRDALRSYDRADLTLRLRYAPQAARQVGELMRQEQACCAFLTFEMYEETDAVTLTVMAPEAARSTVDALFEASVGIAALSPGQLLSRCPM
jgi:hypothetical protein